MTMLTIDVRNGILRVRPGEAKASAARHCAHARMRYKVFFAFLCCHKPNGCHDRYHYLANKPQRWRKKKVESTAKMNTVHQIILAPLMNCFNVTLLRLSLK